MCRGKLVCTVLGDRPELWSRRAPLPVPAWFNTQLDSFSLAVQAAARGDREQALEFLSTVRSMDLRSWYVEHGQISGRFRARGRHSHLLSVVPLSERDPQRSPDRYARLVFRRDGYVCRYCGLRVVPKEVFAAFSSAVGMGAFRATGTNDERHGVVLAFRANVDHVVPWKHGGRTSPDNLVTACWSCNYGKAGYTIEEIGIDDPRISDPVVGEWDGMLSHLPGLRAHAV